MSKLLLFSETSKNPALIIPATNTQKTIHLSYHALHNVVVKAQIRLAELGIGPGSKVALAIRNRIEFVITFLALIRQGATTSPLNPDFAVRESSEILGYMKPMYTIVAANHRSVTSDQNVIEGSKLQGVPVAEVVWDSETGSINITTTNQRGEEAAAVIAAKDIQPTDPVLLHYTSGTTGRPKAVELTHQIITASCDIIIAAHELTARDRTMLVAPMFHVGGTCSSLFSTLCSGGCVIMPPSLSSTFWHQFQEHGATWYHAVPTLHRLLLSFPRPKQLTDLRFVRSGGTGISADLIQLLEKELGCPLLEGYGMTETAQAVFTNHDLDVKFLVDGEDQTPRLVFHPSASGEICVRGGCVIAGYAEGPEVNEAAFFDGYFRTGDLGMLCDDGYIQVTGRIKEMINKGGEKISPYEIEELLMTHPAVKHVACFRVHDDAYGEEIGVAIVVREGHNPTALEIKRFVRLNASLFKVPKKVIFVSALPVNRTGKYQRAKLAEEYGS
ncbi:hypothetical protein ANOM_010796 [Aspergillus nomiae NRRL 13137]|uniref:Peroxisomal-coenzyme A synthetase n=1 Tax=Aspergillus nomiae NRRL (strain ATCC 15546 / NRRL 13137 / CBS 260.88 / M93) TaxID=1509407 RepID=A0A0L1IN68_ASPN3|nr:uncharacterized protein ANOM_010796 [Aspergillus nomiae NRRL 13137]KNG80653.1 hypothetical protein ANOM_010796 [Aspergillus nomiae NRRL 13137]